MELKRRVSTKIERAVTLVML